MIKLVLLGLLLFIVVHIVINIFTSIGFAFGFGFKTFSSFNAFTIGINNEIILQEDYYDEQFTIGLFILEINLYFQKSYTEKDLEELKRNNETNNQIS